MKQGLIFLFFLVLVSSSFVIATTPYIKMNETVSDGGVFVQLLEPDTTTGSTANVTQVNSSDYWDDLDTPADIALSDLGNLAGNVWNIVWGYLTNVTGDLSLNETLLNNSIGDLITNSLSNYYNKSQVDDIASAIAFDFFFTNQSSDLSGHYNLVESDEGHPESALTSNALPVGSNSIGNFTTILGQPEFTQLRKGIYDMRLHLFKTGTRDVTITPMLYNMSADGLSKSLLITFATSILLTTVDAVYDLHGILDEEVIIGSDERLHVEFTAEVSGGGSNPTVTLDMEGTTDTHMSIETSSNAFEQIFIRQDSVDNNYLYYNGTLNFNESSLPNSTGFIRNNTDIEGSSISDGTATLEGGNLTGINYIGNSTDRYTLAELNTTINSYKELDEYNQSRFNETENVSIFYINTTDNGLVAYYGFNNITGNYINSVTDFEDGYAINQVTFPQGHINESAYMVGTNDAIYVKESIGGNYVTVSMWINNTSPINAGTTRAPICFHYDPDGAGNACFGFGGRTGGLVNEIMWTHMPVSNTYTGWCEGGGATIPTGWHHLVARHNGSEYNIFLDNVQKDNCTSNLDPAKFWATRITSIGGAVNSGTTVTYDWIGVIDEVRLYDYALTDAEIQNLYEDSTYSNYSVNETIGTLYSYFNMSETILVAKGYEIESRLYGGNALKEIYSLMTKGISKDGHFDIDYNKSKVKDNKITTGKILKSIIQIVDRIKKLTRHLIQLGERVNVLEEKQNKIYDRILRDENCVINSITYTEYRSCING